MIDEYIEWVQEINSELSEKFSNLKDQDKAKFFLEYYIPTI